MAISPKALRIFAAVEVLRDSQADIRHALATLFEPDLAKFNGQLFDAALLANEINKQYHLGITADVVEGFAEIFHEKKWIEKKLDGNTVAYIVTCTPYTDVPKDINKFSAETSELARVFREFIVEISPLNPINKSDSELIDDLVEWLLLLDRANEDEIRAASTSYRVGNKIVLDVGSPGEGGAHSETTFLSARFVQYLFKIKSPFIPLLVELAEVGLVTEVVRDFQRPTGPVKKSDLNVYLDAPLALDYIGLSGAAPEASVDAVLGSVRKLGGNIRIFRQSVEEMQSNLHAMLNRPVTERTGPTADALRRREVLEAFVRQVAAKPDRFLAAKGVAILEQNLDMYPNEHKFFPKGAYEELYSQIGWVREDAAKHHDAALATFVMRKRSGARSGDVFDVKHVVLTRNPQFAKLSRRIARDNSFIGPNHVGPVIHQRQLATALWLRIGAGRDSEIPRSYVLAACRRVLTLRKNIVDKVHQFKASLSEAQAEQIEILLAEDRSAQILMDKTLGSANIIDSRNIGLLLEEMKKAQIAEYRDLKDAELRDLQQASARDQKALKQDLDLANSSVEEVQNLVSRREAEITAVYEKMTERANKRARRMRRFVSLSIYVLFVAFLSASFFGNVDDMRIKAVAFVLVLSLGSLFQFNKRVRHFIFQKLLRQHDENALSRTASEFGIDPDEAARRTAYTDGEFVLQS